MAEINEEQIVCMLNDPVTRDRGFTLLMEAYKERIYWHIRRLVVQHADAEDILQETFINVYRYAGSFNGHSKLYTWLYRIATNECTRWLKKNKMKKELRSFQDSGKIENSGYIQVEEKDIILKFQLAIRQLPEKQRIVFSLRYYDELNYEEIGQIMNSSVNTLKTNYHYAMEKVRDYMINN